MKGNRALRQEEGEADGRCFVTALAPTSLEGTDGCSVLWEVSRGHVETFFFFFVFFVVVVVVGISWAAPEAYGGSQARG